MSLTADSESSQATGGFSVVFSLTVIQVGEVLSLYFNYFLTLVHTVHETSTPNHFISLSYIEICLYFVWRKSECQQLICEILRATPEAATADAAVQTARLANKGPVKEKRQVYSENNYPNLYLFMFSCDPFQSLLFLGCASMLSEILVQITVRKA